MRAPTPRRKISFLIACVALLSSPVLAANKVSSPDVTKGQIELEYRGGYDIDDIPARDAQQIHRFVGNYGITERWRTEFKVNLAGDSGDLDWTFLEWSNRYQIFKEGEAWARLAVQENYKFSLVGGRADRLELTVLAAKDVGLFSHITNVNFENEVGDDARGGTNFSVGWKTKYKWRPSVEPGFEAYADFGKFGASASETPDKYLLGPNLSGRLAPGVKYDVGFLFGLNDDTPDGRLKIILTYSF
jgi:hypothetical protein